MSYSCTCGKTIENDNWKIKRHQSSKFHLNFLENGITAEINKDLQKEKIKLRRQKYYSENKEKEQEYSKNYYTNHREKMNEINKENQRKKIAEKSFL